MDISEFVDSTQDALKTGDAGLVKELERIACQKNDPYYYANLGFMFEPISKEWVDAEERKVNLSSTKSAAPLKNDLLDNLDNLTKIKDSISASHYFSLALKGMLELAENRDADAMSALSDMYYGGCGIPIDRDKGKYWLNQCYLTKHGVTFDEWSNRNA